MVTWGAICFLLGAGLSLRRKVWSLVPASLLISVAHFAADASVTIVSALVGTIALQLGYIFLGFARELGERSADVRPDENIIDLTYQRKFERAN